ncbi:NACHT domain-containing protein [Streptomyces silvae]|uniref:NACHT domain-containing protein n=1 Tax=Streptomyces silvae TaxID=2803812 RepID=UPI0027DB2FCE|nr:NACHT domain-containing protein [Streptomyces silvae]
MRAVQPADRTVVVSGALQGSGVLLTDRLVLTCAHVVRGSSGCHLGHPDVAGPVPATVAWIDHDLDVALLQAASPVLPVGPARLGLVDTRQAMDSCEITGFPRIQRYGAEKHAEADQYTATVLPMAGRMRNLLVCDLDGPPVIRSDQAPSVLAGLSGGPVFAGDVLLGIARQVPQQRGGRRVECVPLGPVLTAKPFRLVYEQSGPALRHERVHGHFPRDLRYEEEYAASIGAAYRRTKIFGLDELGRHDSEWDLDTAYLSLEAQSQPQSRTLPSPGPQRVDALLADRPRVLLRGDAGAGKTTLLWWLAAHAAARTLADALDPLNGLIPFVVPLRTLRARGSTFPGPAQLSGAAGLVVDDAPDGWAGRVLESGRALLLVDGLDEVPPEDREEAHAWLSQLLRRYPETRCVATVRPLAVAPDWLGSEDFEELRLLPMRDGDIQSFVASWHEAARLDSHGHEALAELERDLSHQFAENAALRDLARTPLLCAVICALHRRRQGSLPATRWKLYSSALEMLLGNRDERRRIKSPEGISMDVEEQTQLLQRIAAWLVREGQSEFSREQALHQVDRTLTGMTRVREQGSAETVLTHLLNRSGLLQERSFDTYQFAHRTFQDFLAAKELVEDDHLNELLRHAPDEQWQDVILLAAGHCGRRQLPVLVHGLLDSAAQTSSLARAELRVLAALCAQHAAWLDTTTRDRVHRSTASLFPPRNSVKVGLLARMGPEALTHLPHPREYAGEIDERTAEHVVDLISHIGGAEAVPHVRDWALAIPGLGPTLMNCWDRYPAEAYAAEVLNRLDTTRLRVRVRSRDQLAALRHVPDADRLDFVGDLPEPELRTALRGRRPRQIWLRANNCLTDLSFLAGSDRLTELRIHSSPGVRDLSPLSLLDSLDELSLGGSPLTASTLGSLGPHPRLRHLSLSRLTVQRFSDLPPLPGVVTLNVRADGRFEADSFEGWSRLTALNLAGAFLPIGPLLAALRRAPQVTALDLTAPAVPDLAGHDPVPSVTTLSLSRLRTTAVAGDRLGQLPKIFPSLRDLTLSTSMATEPSWPPEAPAVDLSPLRGLPGLTVTITRSARVTGAEGIDVRQL